MMSLRKWLTLSMALLFVTCNVVQSDGMCYGAKEMSPLLYTLNANDLTCKQLETPMSVQKSVGNELVVYKPFNLKGLIASAARGSVKNSGKSLVTESGDVNKSCQLVETGMNPERKNSDLRKTLDGLIAFIFGVSAVLLLTVPVLVGYVVFDLWFCEHPFPIDSGAQMLELTSAELPVEPLESRQITNGTQTPELTPIELPVETLESRQTEEEDVVDQIEDTPSQLPTTPDEPLPEFHQVGSYEDQDILPADLLEKLMEKMEEKFDVLNECDLDEKPIELAQAEIHSMSSEASLDEHPKVLAVDSLEVLKRQLGYKERQMTDGQDTDLCSDLICDTKSSSDYGEQHTENIEKVGPLSADSLERLIESIVNDAKKLAEEAKAEETSIDVPVIQEQEVVDKPEEIKPVATNKLKKLRKNGRKPRLVVDAPKNESNV